MAPREGGHEPQEDLSWRGGQIRRGTEPSLQLPRGRGVRLKRNPSQSPLVPDELRAALAAGKGSGRLGPPPKNTLHSARASWLAGQRKVLAAGTTRQPHSAQWESGLGPTLTCPSPASALGAPQRDARSRRGGVSALLLASAALSSFHPSPLALGSSASYGAPAHLSPYRHWL